MASVQWRVIQYRSSSGVAVLALLRLLSAVVLKGDWPEKRRMRLEQHKIFSLLGRRDPSPNLISGARKSLVQKHQKEGIM